jgi:hypothetical protein
MLRHSLVVLALLTTKAAAQPGATPPAEPAPQPVPPPPPPSDEPRPREPLPTPEERFRTPEGAFKEIFDPDNFFEELATNAPELKTIVKGTVRRARRKVAFGPMAGVNGGAYSDSQTGDMTVAFGLGLELFKIPVLPTMENLKAIAKERAKAKAKELFVDGMIKGKNYDPLEIRRMMFQIWTEALREVLGMENLRAKRLEKPSLLFGVEAFHTFDAAHWGGRLRLGTGIWKLTAAFTSGFAISVPRASVVVGAEIGLPIQLSKGPRSPVLNVFMRWDHEVRERTENMPDHFASFGARLLLDII